MSYLFIKYLTGLNYIRVKNGIKNIIDISKKAKLRNSKIKITGKNNEIVIKDGSLLRGCDIKIVGDGNKIIINENVTLNNLNIIFDNEGQVINIGKGTNMARRMIVSLEKYPIIIGEDCNISYDVEIRNTDSHMIFDKNTKKRVNYGNAVTIGNHVWLGTRTMILKGSNIGTGSVIGACSVVSGNIPSNVIAIGIPATIKKTNIFWTRDEVMERKK
ncbi:acyltransferase [uncultured Fusobacterium sp.]|uniref:acyltransferase n=1 Tax=uncultured Fusobacterium sp. TaxID=159267 RepID=UPI002587164E|nr:acyltransferase [uncultured Fusobacterium sp.]